MPRSYLPNSLTCNANRLFISIMAVVLAIPTTLLLLLLLAPVLLLSLLCTSSVVANSRILIKVCLPCVPRVSVTQR